MPYRRRIIDDELDAVMPALPAIAIEGLRGVGKTATAAQRATTVLAVDDPAVREILEADADLVDRPDGTVLLDEWQRLPHLWDVVRRRVDAGAPAGRYLLTGSAPPSDAPVHPGAGRIARLRLRPLSLFERGVGDPLVRLSDMLSGRLPSVAGSSAVTVATYAHEIVRSGMPGLRDLPSRARRLQIEGYVASALDHDLAEQGLRVRRPATLRAWLTAYAAATATTTSYNAILDAATSGEGAKPAKTTTIAYREALTRLWLLDPVPGWLPTANALRRLGQAPKHHLADPALAAHLLGVDAEGLLSPATARGPAPRGGTLLGQLFESLVAQSVHTYAQAAEASVSHLRTRDGDHEIDLIVEGRDHGVVALEVKAGGVPTDEDVRHLLWLRDRIGDALLDAGVLYPGRHAYRRPDGIAVIPAASLAP
jgi:hypothetical protein